MTPSINTGKPAWFELADSDALSADVRKVNKKLPAAAVLVSGAILATGAFFASGSSTDASAAQVSNPTLATSVAAPATSVASLSLSASSSSASASASAGKATIATTSIKNPAQVGIPAPTGHGDDEGQENNHEGD
jgi:hypothetical protein